MSTSQTYYVDTATACIAAYTNLGRALFFAAQYSTRHGCICMVYDPSALCEYVLSPDRPAHVR